ncbi:hypothetical protein CNMCM8689_000066 [Aspergillus fumigatus]|nr:hypothetical protein CNMCM8057_008605 [Aspergillus fumigatus]KAF4281943.1 hypothetical protein CNMCM8689_000066 [Aspergillus fumigatus]KAH1354838.1 hypothetical protein KXX14_000623 [Aspergillus fumigatus]KAH2129227.1 hypothetical protein KXW66_008641 [Aspergillus fumigatus]KAH2190403.1 hypothetical protein KXV88_008114 [Aspergillus fumigatus]
MALARRLAILPGGLGGLGSSIGKKLREQGAHLAILYAPFEAARREELLESGYGGGSDAIRTYECDITAPSSVESAFHALEREMIRASSSTQSDVVFPSILINTAGYVSLSDMEMTPPEETMKHLTTNIFGPMLCSQAFARLYFAASKTAEASANPSPPGRIVNIASQAAHVALPRHGAYCASKAALFVLPEEVADAVVFLCQDSSEVQHLLQHHFTELRSQGRPETSFALDLTAFLDPSITLYTAWEGDSLLGCGALKQLSPTHGEIKSMRTAPGHLRKGVAKTILKHIVAEARERKYQSLSLETGTDGRFESARRLYLGMGFEQHFILVIYLLPNDPESTFAQNLARARVSLLAEDKDFFSRLSPVFCRSQLRLTR